MILLKTWGGADFMKIAGLDIGTTGCKCTVFDRSGTNLGYSYREYPIRRAVDKQSIDVDTIMGAVFEAIAEMSSKYPDIAGIGVTSFGETFVFTDADGHPLHDAMLYTDSRGADECQELIERLGEKNISVITGLRPHEMYSISKMMWIKKHAPKLYSDAKHAFLMMDYVIYHLTGTAQIDYSLASRTMAFDIHTLSWSREIFQAAGIDVSLMSHPVPTGTSAGGLLPEAALKCGLSTDTIVVTISHDQVSAAVGAGAFDGETAVDGAGTVECLTPVYDSLPDLDIMYQGYYSAVPYVLPGKYVAYAFSYTGGALTGWCVNTLAKKEKEEAKNKGISVYDLLEERFLEKRIRNGIPPKAPGDLMVLPHFAGAATPYMDNGSKGVFLGLTLDTEVPDLYYACLEGVAYELFLNYRSIASSGIHFKKIHATGGGAKSSMWMQMKADMLNLPVAALETSEAGTTGSAMLTGIAIGMFADLREAAENMVNIKQIYEPDPAVHAAYEKKFEIYEKLYRSVRPLL